MTSLDWNVSITVLSMVNVVPNLHHFSEPQTDRRVCPFFELLLSFTNKNNELGLAILKCGVKNKVWPSSS